MVADQIQAVGNAQGVDLGHNRHGGGTEISDHHAFFRGGDIGVMAAHFDVAGKAVGFDITNVVRRGHVGDVNHLYAAITVGHQGQVAATGQAVNVWVRHIHTAQQQVRQTKLTVAILLPEQQQLAGVVIQVQSAGAFAWGVAAVPVLLDFCAQLFNEGTARVTVFTRAASKAGLARQHDIFVADQFANAAAKHLCRAIKQWRVRKKVAAAIALRFVHRIKNKDTGARWRITGQGFGIAQ